MKLVDKSKRRLYTVFFATTDIWYLGSLAPGERWLDIFPVNAPPYWILETSMCGLDIEELPVLQSQKLALYENVIASVEAVPVRSGMPPIIGLTPDIPVAVEVEYNPATSKSHAQALLAVIRGLGGIVWGALVQTGVGGAGQFLQVRVSARDFHDASNEAFIGVINIFFTSGFLRTNQMPRFIGDGANKAVIRYSPNTPGNGHLLRNMDSIRSNVGRQSIPMQFKFSAALIRLPGTGLKANVVGAILNF
jgi:hypothetical protein